VSSHLLKRMVPAAFLSAVVVVLAFGVSVAQAALIRGRGAPAGSLPSGHGGTSVWLAVTAAAILAVIVGGIVYAIRADSRQVASVAAEGEPTRLPEREGESEAQQERRAA
jgi:hypothetical protein